MFEKLKDFYAKHKYGVKTAAIYGVTGLVYGCVVVWLVKTNQRLSAERLEKLGWTGPGIAELVFDDPGNKQLWVREVPIEAVGELGKEWAAKQEVSGNIAVALFEKYD
jgi:hypothetical protein